MLCRSWILCCSLRVPIVFPAALALPAAQTRPLVRLPPPHSHARALGLPRQRGVGRPYLCYDLAPAYTHVGRLPVGSSLPWLHRGPQCGSLRAGSTRGGRGNESLAFWRLSHFTKVQL